jgi:hypothetical protein
VAIVASSGVGFGAGCAEGLAVAWALVAVELLAGSAGAGEFAAELRFPGPAAMADVVAIRLKAKTAIPKTRIHSSLVFYLFVVMGMRTPVRPDAP